MEKKTRGRPKKIKEPTIEVTKTSRRFGTLKEVEVTDPIYDEYGVCISCKGGKEGCLHNNLTETNGGTYCTVCGICVSA